MYKVNSVFASIQGEGPSVGYPAIFIRFAHCTLNCGFCDTDRSVVHEVDFAGLMGLVRGELTSLGYAPYEEDFTLTTPLRCVLTGGEPLLQVDIGLVNALEQLGFIVCVETSGCSEIIDQGTKEYLDSLLAMCSEIVVSPKVPGTSELLLSWATCLKVLCPIEQVAGLHEGHIRGFIPYVGRSRVKRPSFVFQPITPVVVTGWEFKDNCRAAVALARRWQSKYSEQWRVIPQVHRWLDIA